MTKECKIKCKVRRGMVDDEFIARIDIVNSQGADGEAECWAYSDSVDLESAPNGAEEVDGALHAYRLGEKDELVAVVLPQTTFQNGPNVVVRQSSLML